MTPSLCRPIDKEMESTKRSRQGDVRRVLRDSGRTRRGDDSPEFNTLRFVRRQACRSDVRFDKDGNVWLTDAVSHRLVKLNPRTGEQKDFVLPDPTNGIHEVNIAARHDLLPDTRAAAIEHERLLGFNPKTENSNISFHSNPDNVVRNPIKWTQSLAFDSKDTFTSAGSWAAH